MTVLNLELDEAETLELVHERHSTSITMEQIRTALEQPSPLCYLGETTSRSMEE